jgi:hypothetical protein
MMAQAKGFKLSFDHKALVVRFYSELAASHVRESGDFDALITSSEQHAKQETDTLEDGGSGVHPEGNAADNLM